MKYMDISSNFNEIQSYFNDFELNLQQNRHYELICFEGSFKLKITLGEDSMGIEYLLCVVIFSFGIQVTELCYLLSAISEFASRHVNMSYMFLTYDPKCLKIKSRVQLIPNDPVEYIFFEKKFKFFLVEFLYF